MKNSRAFTLIELLVVVLIIGILAAVAVPQYQKAVGKARAMQAVTMLKAIVDAQEVYYLANASYTDNLEELDVTAPSELQKTASSGNSKDFYKFSCSLVSEACTGNIDDANLPTFEFRLQHGYALLAGRHWCRANSPKTKLALTICQSMGVLDTDVGNNDYFIINK